MFRFLEALVAWDAKSEFPGDAGRWPHAPLADESRSLVSGDARGRGNFVLFGSAFFFEELLFSGHPELSLSTPQGDDRIVRPGRVPALESVRLSGAANAGQPELRGILSDEPLSSLSPVQLRVQASLHRAPDSGRARALFLAEAS